jgi:hypothetical protein
LSYFDIAPPYAHLGKVEVLRFEGIEVLWCLIGKKFSDFQYLGFEVPRFQGFEVSRTRKFRVVGFLGYKESSIRSFKVSKFLWI